MFEPDAGGKEAKALEIVQARANGRDSVPRDEPTERLLDDVSPQILRLSESVWTGQVRAAASDANRSIRGGPVTNSATSPEPPTRVGGVLPGQ